MLAELKKSPFIAFHALKNVSSGWFVFVSGSFTLTVEDWVNLNVTLRVFHEICAMTKLMGKYTDF